MNDAIAAALPAFLADVNSRVNANMKRFFPNALTEKVVADEPGPKYLRLILTSSDGIHRSAYGFIRLEDGALLKSDSWKRPTLNRARGSLFDASTWHCAGPYSIG